MKTYNVIMYQGEVSDSDTEYNLKHIWLWGLLMLFTLCFLSSNAQDSFFKPEKSESLIYLTNLFDYSISPGRDKPLIEFLPDRRSETVTILYKTNHAIENRLVAISGEGYMDYVTLRKTKFNDRKSDYAYTYMFVTDLRQYCRFGKGQLFFYSDSSVISFWFDTEYRDKYIQHYTESYEQHIADLFEVESQNGIALYKFIDSNIFRYHPDILKFTLDANSVIEDLISPDDYLRPIPIDITKKQGDKVCTYGALRHSSNGKIRRHSTKTIKRLSGFQDILKPQDSLYKRVAASILLLQRIKKEKLTRHQRKYLSALLKDIRIQVKRYGNSSSATEQIIDLTSYLAEYDSLLMYQHYNSNNVSLIQPEETRLYCYAGEITKDVFSDLFYDNSDIKYKPLPEDYIMFVIAKDNAGLVQSGYKVKWSRYNDKKSSNYFYGTTSSAFYQFANLYYEVWLEKKNKPSSDRIKVWMSKEPNTPVKKGRYFNINKMPFMAQLPDKISAEELVDINEKLSAIYDIDDSDSKVVHIFLKEIKIKE